MNARVLFLDDDPRTCTRLRESLVKNGYTICSPNTVEDALHEITVNHAEILVHGAHKTKTHWDVCTGIFKQYPNFPSIHVATGPLSDVHTMPIKGAYHVQLRPMIPEREFLKRVRKLIFIGRLKRENDSLRRAVELQDKMDRVFDTLDIQDLKHRMVDFFATEFKARNAFFLSPGGYGYYLQEMWKVTHMSGAQDPAKFHKHALVSSKPSHEQELSAFLNETAQFLPSGWELRKARTFLPSEGKGKSSYCFVPLFGHQSKVIQGYVFMVDPLLYGDSALEKVLPHLTRVLGRHFEHAMTYTDAKSLSYIDDLTDLYNQRYLKLVLDKEISRCQRNKEAFSVLFMDIDHFKHVNDTKGHLIGSRVLVELSKILHDNIRTMDYGFRYGGDEFLLILVGTDSKNALTVAERIRKQVEATAFELDDRTKLNITLSIGIATFPEHATTKEQIIELADRAMYCGKNQSRNVVYVAS